MYTIHGIQSTGGWKTLHCSSPLLRTTPCLNQFSQPTTTACQLATLLTRVKTPCLLWVRICFSVKLSIWSLVCQRQGLLTISQLARDAVADLACACFLLPKTPRMGMRKCIHTIHAVCCFQKLLALREGISHVYTIHGSQCTGGSKTLSQRLALALAHPMSYFSILLAQNDRMPVCHHVLPSRV